MTDTDDSVDPLAYFDQGWECGSCHRITKVTHFYEDRATGLMQHEADPEKRRRLADKCGWTFNDGLDATSYRCSFGSYPHDEHEDEGRRVRWGSGPLDRTSGARPPVRLHRNFESRAGGEGSVTE